MSERPSRNQLLETGGTFTIEELEEIGLALDRLAEGERMYVLVDERAPVRLVPLKLLETAKKYYEERKDPKELFTILRCGYEIYRNTADREVLAPLVFSQGALEWPEPAGFGWDDLDAVVSLGFAMGALDRTKEVKVIIGNKMTSLGGSTGQTEEKEVSELIANPQKLLKFKIPKLADVRIINSFAWQGWANVALANGLSQAIEGLENGSAEEYRIKELINFLFNDVMTKARLLPVSRYAREGESPFSQGNLFVFSF